jgi:hypothetical protein
MALETVQLVFMKICHGNYNQWGMYLLKPIQIFRIKCVKDHYDCVASCADDVLAYSKDLMPVVHVTESLQT